MKASRTTKKSAVQAQRLPARTLVLDNGAHTIKAGFVNGEDAAATGASAGNGEADSNCDVIPNCIARGTDVGRQQKIYVADQLDNCRDFAEMAFRRPVEKGYIVSWDGETDVWKQAFFNEGAKLYCNPHETNLILTEAPNCPQNLQHNTDQMIFEEFEFASAYRCLGPSLSAYNPISSIFGDRPESPTAPPRAADALLLIDSGHSHTTVTPLLNGRPLQAAIRRLDVGGKVLTNRMKELISLRQFNLMDDPHLVSQIKEDTCFVSREFPRDLERARAGDPSIVVDYVLPDYHSTTRGYVRRREAAPAAKGTGITKANSRIAAAAAVAGSLPAATKAQHEDTFPLTNERFTVPELVFRPSDLAYPSTAGLAEVVIQSLSRLPPGLWPVMLGNMLCVGGTSQLAGFAERLEEEMRGLCPVEVADGVRARRPPDCIRATCNGGRRMVESLCAKEGRGTEGLRDIVVTKEEYRENGAQWAARKFAGLGPGR
ncbi:MAG: Actin- protein 6 [Alyxoria varia]|nr:MAG: Actin- protein 6 [Alyxoria varia]